MFDKYHLTTIETLRQLDAENSNVVFELFYRDNKTFYITKNFPDRVQKVIEKVTDFSGMKNLRINDIKIANSQLRKDTLKVEKRFPLVQISSQGLDAIIYESALLNHIQLELIYTTRVLEVINVCKRYNITTISDFGLRRAPGLYAADLFSEICIDLGLTTSNMNLYNRFPHKVVGTLPHAFVQYVTVTKAKTTNLDKLIREEISLWTYLLDKQLTKVILPDAYDFKTVVKEVIQRTKAKSFIIRIDSGDLVENTDYVVSVAKTFNKDVKVILSGDLCKEKLLEILPEFQQRNLLNAIYSIAIGTQVVNNVKPLSIVYKIVQIDDIPVTKFASSKGYSPGCKKVVVSGDSYELKNGKTNTIDTYEYDV